MTRKKKNNRQKRKTYRKYDRFFDTDQEMRKAVQYHQAGQFGEADEIYKKILEFNPKHADALHLSGLTAHQTGKHDMAVRLISKAIRHFPDNPLYHSNLSSVFRSLNKPEKVISCLRKAVALKANYAEAHNKLGIALREKGAADEALSCFQNAVKFKPDFIEAHYNMGLVLKDDALPNDALPNDALPCFQRVVQLQPNHTDAYIWMGILFQEQGKLDRAMPCYEKVLVIKPDCAEAWNNMGNVFRDYGQSDKAMACYQKAVQLNPDFAEAHGGMGLVFQEQGQFDEAILCYQKALDLKPDLAEAHSSMGAAFRYQGKYAQAIPYYMKALQIQPAHPTATGNLVFLLRHTCFWGETSDFAEKKLDELTRKASENSMKMPETPFLSLVRHDDPSRNLSVAKSWASDISARMSDRKQIFSFDTSGADFLDYIISDRIVTPENQAPFYTEKFVRMPHCYMISDHTQAVSDRKWKNADFGLPRDAFVFCSFNQAYKIDEPMFDIWMGILRKVPGSVLWLMGENEAAENNLKREAEEKGIGAKRLVFAKKLPSKADHLSRLRLANIALDTRIYNGHATTSDALWAGIPVITLRGNHFASRSSSSLLTAAGLPEMITRSPYEYERLAVRLAGYPRELEAICEKLAKNRFTEPFFDTPGFVRDLEKAFKFIWEIFLAGKEPRSVEIRKSEPEMAVTTNSRQPAADNRQQTTNDFRKAAQYFHSEQFGKAEKIYNDILERDPNHSDTLNALGFVAHQTGRNEMSIRLIRKAIGIDPENFHYHFSLAFVLQHQDRLGEAVSAYQKVLELKPDCEMGLYNMGNALQTMGKAGEALDCYEKAVTLKPDYAEAHNNMGGIFLDKGELEKAEKAYQQAVTLKPDHVAAHNNLGNVLHDQGKPARSISCYQKALALDPNYAIACHSLVFLLIKACQWKTLRGFSAKLDEFTLKALENGERTVERPFVSIMRHADPSLNLAVAKSWADDIKKRLPKSDTRFSFDSRRSEGKKITVGYLSCDFHDHATAHLMLSLFGLHDRKNFEVYVYSYGKDDGSRYRKQIAKDCDKFADLRELKDDQAAKRIWEDQVDILVDLKGYTKGNRMEICAYRPAPVQVSYLGFPGTCGANFFDYIITDKIVSPKSHSSFYTEKPVYLPHCYQVNDHTQPIADKNFGREDFGLSEDAFVFCSFCQSYKIEPTMFGVWMNILLRIPNSVLWLLRSNDIAEENLRRESREKGVNPERLIFSEHLPKNEHLARHKLADLVLDTRIYNGHTTTSDALWACIPVLTLQGAHFASRVSSSILSAVGLPELITHNLEEYENLAVQLATHSEELRAIGRKLEENCLTKPLFDTPDFVRNLENAFKSMWEIFLAGEKPRGMEIMADGNSKLETRNPKSEMTDEFGTKSLHQAAGDNKPQTANDFRKAAQYYHQGRLDEVISCFQKILKAEPGNAEACYSMGIVLKKQGRLDQAISCFRNVLELRPDMADVHIYIGNILQTQDKFQDAIQSYQKALDLNPNSAIIYNNMGNILKDQGRLEEAISSYKKALRLNPNMPPACNNLLFQLQQACEWGEAEELGAKIDGMTKEAFARQEFSNEEPFINLTRHADPLLNFHLAKLWAKAVETRVLPLKRRSPFIHERLSGSRITVGYLSNDFYNHATAHLTLRLFGLHNRDTFRVLCYSYGKDDGSSYRKQIEQDCDKFVDIRAMNIGEAAKRIYEDHVDILVDMKGYIGGNRMDICALRPAPVQVSYLGFPGTAGADFFDYIIADKIVIPQNHRACFSENIVCMPHCYQINDNMQTIAEKEWGKADFCLPGDAFVFCSFNRPYKIEPLMFDMWMRILRNVPGSVLWLLPGNETAKKNLRKEAEARDVNPERLVFTEMLPKDKHLARHRLADLVLDTRIYNGHTSTSDAMWAGVPVITLQGTHFASRVSSSILTAIGLPELITHSPEEYEALAVRLATHPEELNGIRQKLAKNRFTTPLFDTPRFVRHLEEAYKEIWKIFMSREKARDIDPQPATRNLQPAASEYQRAVQHHKAGNLKEAEEIYRKIVRANPEHPDALHYLGAIAHQTGDNENAVKFISEAIRIRCDNPFYHYNLACVFQAEARFEEALPYFQTAVQLKPDHFEAHNNMGLTLQSLEKFDEAITCFQHALKVRPDLAEAHNNMGNLFYQQGRMEDALSSLDKALKIKPDYVEALNNMGNIFNLMYRLDEAVACFQKAVALNPDNAETYNSLGNAFQGHGKLMEAISCFEKALEVRPDFAPSYYYKGNVLVYLGKMDEAIGCYEKALDVMPDFAMAAAGKARVLMRKGKFGDARKYLLHLIQSGEKDTEVALAHARVSGYFKEYEEAVSVLKDALSRESAGSGRLARIHFALGELYDKTENYDNAFHHYEQGNALKPVHFDAEKHENYISSMIEVYNPVKKSHLPKAANSSDLPIFIVGMPRSGTTLTEQILSSHNRVFGAGELPDIGNIMQQLRFAQDMRSPRPENLKSLTSQGLNSFADAYLKMLRKLSDDAFRVTDKMPNNFLYLGLIRQLFPNAAIIHCVRDSRDIALSVYFQNFLASHTYAFDLRNIAVYHNEYKRIMHHWKEVFGISMLEVRYEELIENQEAVSREIVAHAGLEWDDRCLCFHKSGRAVATSTYHQVREPVYTRSAGRWKNYEKHLKALSEVL